LSAAICLALASAAALAQTPTVGLNRVTCVPEEANQVFNATIRPEVGGTVVRLYFRWDQHGAMYYVEMFAAGEGKYWGIPPKPEPDNESIEYYAAVVDPAGTVLARSETLLSPVTDDCSVTMTPQQFGRANNLTVGETVEAQEGRKVLGFLCDGVVTRVNFEGIPRPDEICRGCVIPWWEKNDYIVPAAISGGALTLVLVEESPSRP
jgi:hypothetical protein